MYPICDNPQLNCVLICTFHLISVEIVKEAIFENGQIDVLNCDTILTGLFKIIREHGQKYGWSSRENTLVCSNFLAFYWENHICEGTIMKESLQISWNRLLLCSLEYNYLKEIECTETFQRELIYRVIPQLTLSVYPFEDR